MKPTVGRTVHYYEEGLDFNDAGASPYAAIITQVFGASEGSFCNLKVFPPFAEPFDSGSVRNKEYGDTDTRYWVWPPRE